MYSWIIITPSTVKPLSTIYLYLYIIALACIQVLKYSSGSKADLQVPESQDCN